MTLALALAIQSAMAFISASVAIPMHPSVVSRTSAIESHACRATTDTSETMASLVTIEESFASPRLPCLGAGGFKFP